MSVFQLRRLSEIKKVTPQERHAFVFMKYKIEHVSIEVIILLLPFVVTYLVDARTNYTSFLPNGDNVPNDPCFPGQAWFGFGHKSLAGGGSLNSFGLDLNSVGRKWTKWLCKLDSDGDGKTNGQELGDPNCEWTPNSSRASITDVKQLSNPAICEPAISSPACKGANAFLRNISSCASLLNGSEAGLPFISARLNLSPITNPGYVPLGGYNTLKKDQYTFFGGNSNDEMCLVFAEIYSRSFNRSFAALYNTGDMNPCTKDDGILLANEKLHDCYYTNFTDEVFSIMNSTDPLSIYECFTHEFPASSCSKKCYLFLQRHSFFDENKACLTGSVFRYLLNLMKYEENYGTLYRLQSQIERCPFR